jgi:hypothetical protein
MVHMMNKEMVGDVKSEGASLGIGGGSRDLTHLSASKMLVAR